MAVLRERDCSGHGTRWHFPFNPRRALSDDMSKRPARADAPPALSIQERILLFCVASGTDWEHAGITGALVTSMVIKGLIAREPTGGLYLTKEGRAALRTLVGENL